MSNLSGTSLISGIYSGLTSTYSYLSSLNPDGVTLEKINEARSDSTTAANLNHTFASYLQSNFTNIDKDNDGIISTEEMTNLTNQMSSQGLSRTDLTQLLASGASGLSSETVNMILENFDAMDTNHDGRITNAEISAFQVDASKQEKVDEYSHKMATSMSTFYGDDSSSSVDSYSMLSYKYKNINK